MHFRAIAFALVLLPLASGTVLAQGSPDAPEPPVYYEFSGLDLYAGQTDASGGVPMGAGVTFDANKPGRNWSLGYGLRLEHIPAVTVVWDPEFMEPGQAPVQEVATTSLVARAYALAWPGGEFHPYAGASAGLAFGPDTLTLQAFGGLALDIGPARLYIERTASLPLTTDEIQGLDGYRIGLQYAWSHRSLTQDKYDEEQRLAAEAEARRRELEMRQEAARKKAALGTPFGDSGIYVESGWGFYREESWSPRWVSDFVTISGTLANRGSRTYRLMFIEADVYDAQGIIAKESTVVTDFGPGERRRFEILVYLPGVRVEDVELRIRY